MKVLFPSMLMLTAAGATLAQADATKVTISHAVVNEGGPGQRTVALFHVRLSNEPATPVTVGWATENLTATAPGDYVPASGNVVFDGTTDADIPVVVKGDADGTEGSEVFFVRLASTSDNALISGGLAYGVIADDDGSLPRHPRCDLDGKGRSILMALYPDDHTERHNPQHEDWGTHAGLAEAGGPVLSSPDALFDAEIAAMEDFDGDGTCDVFWLHGGRVILTTTAAGHSVHLPVPSDLTLSAPGPETDWRVIGSGRFDGGAAADLLWWSPTAQPQYQVWLAPFAPRVQRLGLSGWPTDREPIAVADLGGRGAAGILWRDDGGGLSYSAVTDFAVAPPAAIARGDGDIVDAGWTLGAVGDFDGDGFEDLAWQDDGGRVALWFMRGAARRGEILLSPERLVLLDQNGILRGPR